MKIVNEGFLGSTEPISTPTLVSEPRGVSVSPLLLVAAATKYMQEEDL